MIFDGGGKVKCFVRGFTIDLAHYALARLQTSPTNLAAGEGCQNQDFRIHGFAGLCYLFLTVKFSVVGQSY